MHERGVEVLRVVLDEKLPVERPHRVLDHAELHPLDAERIDGTRERAEVERGRLQIGVREDEPCPGRDLHRKQPRVGRIEAGDVSHAACPREPAVELVDPGVIRTLQHAGRAAPFRHR